MADTFDNGEGFVGRVTWSADLGCLHVQKVECPGDRVGHLFILNGDFSSQLLLQLFLVQG